MISKITHSIKLAYQKLVAHMIKTVGLAGATIMALDPQAIGNAASSYLGAGAQRKIGVGLFAVITARAWYAGRKVAALQAQLAAMQVQTLPPLTPPPTA
jgi:hypothetical protein